MPTLKDLFMKIESAEDLATEAMRVRAGTCDRINAVSKRLDNLTQELQDKMDSALETERQTIQLIENASEVKETASTALKKAKLNSEIIQKLEMTHKITIKNIEDGLNSTKAKMDELEEASKRSIHSADKCSIGEIQIESADDENKNQPDSAKKKRGRPRKEPLDNSEHVHFKKKRARTSQDTPNTSAGTAQEMSSDAENKQGQKEERVNISRTALKDFLTAEWFETNLINKYDEQTFEAKEIAGN